MGHHYVGKVFYFHPQPVPVENDVQVPGLGSGGDIDEILIHYEPAEIAQPAQLRLSDWQKKTGLSVEELKRFGGIGFGKLANLRQNIAQLSEDELSLLAWSGLPKYLELKATAEFLWKSFNLSRSGPWTASQLTWLLWRLYRKSTLSSFFVTTFGAERPIAPDDLFAFLRSCEFSYPEIFMCLQASLSHNTSVTPNYSLFVAKLENWFMPEGKKSLEEVGFPIVLFERLGIPVGANDFADELIDRAQKRLSAQAEIDPIEREMVQGASLSAGYPI